MPTLFDKLWAEHVVDQDGDAHDLIAIDRTLLHERTGGVALKSLIAQGHSVIDRARVFAIMDHIVSFRAGRKRDEARSPGGEVFITETRDLAHKVGIHLIDTDDSRQGIVHVVAPELGIALPGLSLVCPDSHTCSLGALGALAIGIGSSDVEHVLATGVLRASKPRQLRICIEGNLRKGVYSKDIALYLISKYGAGGGARRAIEFCGDVVEAMSIEARLTLCNMAVEFAAYTAVIAPDKKVIDYIQGKQFSPTTKTWQAAQQHWEEYYTDDSAIFDEEIVINAADIYPFVTWGISPDQASMIKQGVPTASKKDPAVQKALTYMGLAAGAHYHDLSIEGAFIGSCTNGRLSDLQEAAKVLKGHKVASGVRAVCVPGSKSVLALAEREGLDKIFQEAGFEWGAPGCAMCFYAGGETFSPKARVISSTNRNFKGRQGPDVRTHLASPATVAASAIAGRIISVSELERVTVTGDR